MFLKEVFKLNNVEARRIFIRENCRQRCESKSLVKHSQIGEGVRPTRFRGSVRSRVGDGGMELRRQTRSMCRKQTTLRNDLFEDD